MLSMGAEFAILFSNDTRTMNFSKPFIRFRRTRHKSFQDGYLRHARQRIMFEFGASDDLRTEVADLKQKVDRLTAELAKQKAIVGMLRALASEPAAPPVLPVRLQGEAQNCSGKDGRGSKSPVPQRAAAETNVVIRLIPDEQWI